MGGKVLWKEGMFLEPHHFQLLERMQTAHVNARVNSLVYGGYQYGFTELDIDRDALLSGNFSIVRASGVFPDGNGFSIGVNTSLDHLTPAATSPPLSRSFATYCNDRRALDVYLAVYIGNTETGDAEYMESSGGVSSSNGRYIEKTVPVADEFSRRNIKEIEIGEPNYIIRFEGEPLDDCVWLRIARLTKTGAGYMESARDFSPPLLFTRVSNVIRDGIGGLLELLWARVGSLAKCRRQSEYGQAFFSSSQENAFRLLNTLCAYVPLLARVHELPKIHPFYYYTQLTALYGGLLSFSPSINLENFPPYNHDNPAASFIALIESIRDLLKVEFWTDCTEVPLERVNSATWFCRFPYQRFAAGVNLFIGVSANVAQKELLIDVLQRMKAASKERLDLLISSSLQGLPLIHVKNIPEGLAAKPEYVYFVIDRESPLYNGVETSDTLGIHLSGGGYPDMKIEVLALKHHA